MIEYNCKFWIFNGTGNTSAIRGITDGGAVRFPISLQEFLRRYRETRATENRVGGTALFFARNVRGIPLCVRRTTFVNNKIDRDSILSSIVVEDALSGVSHDFNGPTGRARELGDRARVPRDRRHRLDPRNRGIREKAIIYGLEEIGTSGTSGVLRPDLPSGFTAVLPT